MRSHTKYSYLSYGYMTIKKDLTIYSVNALYSIFGKVNGNFEEVNGNIHLMVVSTN